MSAAQGEWFGCGNAAAVALGAGQLCLRGTLHQTGLQPHIRSSVRMFAHGCCHCGWAALRRPWSSKVLSSRQLLQSASLAFSSGCSIAPVDSEACLLAARAWPLQQFCLEAAHCVGNCAIVQVEQTIEALFSRYIKTSEVRHNMLLQV